jgi:hypothetical protein
MTWKPSVRCRRTKISLASATSAEKVRLKQTGRQSHYREQATHRKISDEVAKAKIAESRKAGTYEYDAGNDGFPDRFRHVASDGTEVITDHLGKHGITIFKRRAVDPLATIIRIPDRLVGILIGRNGTTITKIRKQSGCFIKVQDDKGEAQRTVVIDAKSPKDATVRQQRVDQAINAISEALETERGDGIVHVVI